MPNVVLPSNVTCFIFLKGTAGRWVLPVIISASTFGAANGSAYTGGRLVAVAASNGDFPEVLAKTRGSNPPTPAAGLVFQCSLAIFMVMLGDFESLLAYFSVAAWIFYLLAVSTLFVFRRREPRRLRPFRVWTWCPILFCGIACVLVIATTIESPTEACIGVICMVSAYPVYWLKERYGKSCGYATQATLTM